MTVSIATPFAAGYDQTMKTLLDEISLTEFEPKKSMIDNALGNVRRTLNSDDTTILQPASARKQPGDRVLVPGWEHTRKS